MYYSDDKIIECCSIAAELYNAHAYIKVLLKRVSNNIEKQLNFIHANNSNAKRNNGLRIRTGLQVSHEVKNKIFSM